MVSSYHHHDDEDNTMMPVTITNSSNSNSMLAQQLQMSVSHLPLLSAIMQRELQGLTPTSPQLRLAQQHALKAAQQQQNSNSNGNSKQQHTVHVVPLLGLCLKHLMAHSAAAAQDTQGDDEGNSTDAELFASMLECSPFLNALQSELLSLRKVAGSCYDQVQQQLAATGHHLPPAADAASRRNSSIDGSGRGISSPSAGSAAPTATTNSSRYYGQGLDLQLLQQQADAASLDLIHLQDWVSSSAASLAKLSQQYDILITAALAAAASTHDDSDNNAPRCAGVADAVSAGTQGQHNQGGTAAGAAGGRKSGFLAPLLGAMRFNSSSSSSSSSSKGPDSRDGRVTASAPASSGGTAFGGEGVEYVFLTPGVCSHSSETGTYSFTAGVPIDVYSTSIHKLLEHSSSAEHVLWMLSVIYARLRYAAEAAAAAGGMAGVTGAAGVKQWRAPDKFTRSTTKYWVHPSNLLRLKLALTKQLPLLVYGADDPVSSGTIAAAASGAAAAPAATATAVGSGSSDARRVTSLVSSVYFDGPELDVYHTRLAREGGAKLVRIRYYGQRLTGPAGDEQTVFVEQKTHRDKSLGETSYKERASLQQSQLPAFLSRQLPLHEAVRSANKVQLLQQIQDFMDSTQQAPVMRTEYLRSAWQAYDDNAVRFSLDEHMLLLRETPLANSSTAGSWCSPLEQLQHIPACDAIRFPYGILEVKLQDKEAAPAWVHELKTSGVLVEVPQFSKFLHGLALLQPTLVRNNPSWFVWRECAGMALPASMDEMWDLTADRRLRQEMDWQDRMEYEHTQGTALAPAAAGTDVAGMLRLLRAPRLSAAPTAVLDSEAAAAVTASKLTDLPAVPYYELTATAAAAHAAAAAEVQPAGGLARMAGGLHTLPLPGGAQLSGAVPHSYPCHAVDSDVATSSSINSHNSHGHDAACKYSSDAPHDTAHSIMQDGQFGYAGQHACSSLYYTGGGMHYRGPGGGMQPLLGLLLPGRSDSYTHVISRSGFADAAGGGRSPVAAAFADRIDGNSPSFAPHPLTVRVPPSNARSLSSSSMATSDIDSYNSSGSMGGPAAAGATEAALPHFTTCSSSSGHSLGSPHSPAHPRLASARAAAACRHAGGYPRVCHTHDDGDVAHAHDSSNAAAATAAGSAPSRRPHSRGSSSGGTSDWMLPAVNPAGGAGGHGLSRLSAASSSASAHLAPASTRPGAHAPAAAGSGSGAGAFGVVGGLRKTCTDQLGPVRGDDVVVDFGKLAAQAAAPAAASLLTHNTRSSALSAAAAAAGAGRPHVIQVHFTGAVQPVPAQQHANGPSTQLVQEMSQLLPPVGGAGGGVGVAASAVAVDAAAVDAAEAGLRDQAGGVPAAGATTGNSAGAVGGQGKGKGGGMRAYRQRVQQWKAAVGARMKRGLKGGRGKGVDGAGGTGVIMSGSSGGPNEHMMGFAGSGPRQPSYVKPRADPKTFFANERTFLQWLQISVLVMMTGLGMLTGSTIAISNGGSCANNLVCSASRISGAIIAPVSILFMIYAIYLYHKRTRQLLTRSTMRYDDARGPWLLTILLIGVTLVVIVLALEVYRMSPQGGGSGGAPAAAAGGHHG